MKKNDIKQVKVDKKKMSASQSDEENLHVEAQLKIEDGDEIKLEVKL